MLIGTEGVYSFTFNHERKPDCPVCSDNSKDVQISEDLTVEELLEWLLEKQDMWVHRLLCSFPENMRPGQLTLQFPRLTSQAKKPSLSHGGKPIYLQAPPQLEKATRVNLEKKVSELVPAGEEITVTSTSLPFSLRLKMAYA